MQSELGAVELGVMPYRETGTYIVKVLAAVSFNLPTVLLFCVQASLLFAEAVV